MGDVVAFGDRQSPPSRSSATHDHDAEQQLLAALLNKPELREVLPAELGERHFHHADHREIYSLLRASEGSKSAITEVARRWSQGDVGRLDYVTRLYVAATYFGADRQIALARQLIELHRRREVVSLADRMKTEIAADGGPDASSVVMASAITELERIGEGLTAGKATVSIGDAVTAAIDAGEQARMSGGVTGLQTGFPCLDRRLVGMEGGALYVLGARPGVGKTSLALEIALNVARGGVGVLFVSLEMQATQLARRALSLASGVPLGAIRAGSYSGPQADRIVKAQRQIAALPLFIEEEGGLSVNHIALRGRAAHRRHGIGLVVVDHLHIVGAPDGAARMGHTWAVGQVSNGLKRLAKSLDVPVLALAQLNRGLEAREDRRPSLHDLRQSGDIEQDAEAVMLLDRPEMHMPATPSALTSAATPQKRQDAQHQWEEQRRRLAGVAHVIFAKVRDGETGTEELQFDGSRTRFIDPASHQ